jgi:hypothetical protein
MSIKVKISAKNQYGVGLDGVPIELSTHDGSYMNMGEATNSAGYLEIELPYDEDDTVQATIYVNGVSRGVFELENGSNIEFE